MPLHSDGEGKGATFRVLLPMRQLPPAPRPERSVPLATPTAAPRRNLDGMHVLVVDDEEDSRELFAQILESAGARVRTASSAGEALRSLIDDGADVLVSDIEMPQMDGYELLRLARADARVQAKGLVTIALTAYARAADRRRALEAGFDAHIAKPVDPQVLVAAIASLLSAR